MIKCKKCNHPIKYSSEFWFHKKFDLKNGIRNLLNGIQLSRECWKCDCDKAKPNTKDEVKPIKIIKSIMTNLNEMENIIKDVRKSDVFKKWKQQSKSKNEKYFDLDLGIEEQLEFPTSCEITDNEIIYKHYNFIVSNKK